MWCVNFVGALLCTQEERRSSYTSSFCENIDHFDCHTGTVSAYKFWCCLTGVEEGELCGTLYIAHKHVCVQWLVFQPCFSAIVLFLPLLSRCRNCGSPGHRSWECSEQKNVVSNIICTRCGGGGHIASDCKTDMYVCACVGVGFVRHVFHPYPLQIRQPSHHVCCREGKDG